MHINDDESRHFVLKGWIRLIPFFVIFIINNFILAPKLLFRSRITTYIISCLLVLVLVSFLSKFLLSPEFHPEKHEPAKEQMLKGPEQFYPSNIPDHHNKKPPEPPKGPKPPEKRIFDFSVFIIGFLIMGFNSGVKVFIYWNEEQEKTNEKERQYLSTELAFLRQQISPHFFMNTLNNIHALIDIDSEKAKDVIIKLSRMMRYLLYESGEEKISISKEIEFLESYIELIQLRYDSSDLTVVINYPDDLENIFVPSLLFLPLVENAFKHGVQSGKKSFVTIDFSVIGDKFVLLVKNSKAEKNFDEFTKNASGIGLENIKKRLSLIYKENYTIEIKSKEDIFEVLLIIPIG
jgi:two-component sensor histidine kinase